MVAAVAFVMASGGRAGRWRGHRRAERTLGSTRAVVAFVALVAGLLSACSGAGSVVFTVNSFPDGVDVNPGDGRCEKTAGAGDCSLRAAVGEANATATKVPTVRVPGGQYVLTAGSDDVNAIGDLDLAPAKGSMFLQSLAPVSIRGGGGDNVFDVRSGVVSISGFGAWDADSALRVRNGATAKVSASTFSGDVDGINVETGGDLQLESSSVLLSTFAAVRNEGTASLRFVSLLDNNTTLRGAGSTTLTASVLFGGNFVECGAPVISGGWNAVGDASCGLTGAGDVENATTMEFEPVAIVPVPYAAPRYSATTPNPVIDAIPPGVGPCPAAPDYETDQAGSLRPVGAGCDRGAVDTNMVLTVTTPADELDADPSDQRCDTGAGHCSLRAAIARANALPGHDTVVIAAGVDPVLSRPGRNENANATGDLDITGPLDVEGGRSLDRRGGPRPGLRCPGDPHGAHGLP